MRQSLATAHESVWPWRVPLIVSGPIVKWPAGNRGWRRVSNHSRSRRRSPSAITNALSMALTAWRSPVPPGQMWLPRAQEWAARPSTVSWKTVPPPEHGARAGGPVTEVGSVTMAASAVWPRRIVAGIDGSPDSADALTAGRALAARLHGVLRVVAAHDCGRVINPTMVESQVVGGVTQGIGFALTEERVVDARLGVVLNANLEEYKVPTVADIPPITYAGVDLPDPAANPTGAKGIGEPPLVPTAPAIANAVFDAVGVRLRHAPLSRRRILEALADRARSATGGDRRGGDRT
mgnify:CR=1 FL=1